MAKDHPIRGAILLTIGLLLFACMDATTKFLAERYEVPLIVAVRYAVNLGLMLVFLGPKRGQELVRTQRTGLVLVRGGCLAAASLLVGLALQRMPVAETTTIGFLAPILVVVAAGPLLGERTGWRAWSAAVLGFAGILLIVRPGSGLETVGVLCALGGVAANTAYQLLSRTLAATERTIALLFYTALVGTIAFAILLPWLRFDRTPTALELLLFASLGVYGGLGHFLFTAAYRRADVSTLSPMLYLQLLWAGLLGLIVFGHVPDWISLIGMLIVAASGVLVALGTREASKPASRATSGTGFISDV